MRYTIDTIERLSKSIAEGNRRSYICIGNKYVSFYEGARVLANHTETMKRAKIAAIYQHDGYIRRGRKTNAIYVFSSPSNGNLDQMLEVGSEHGTPTEHHCKVFDSDDYDQMDDDGELFMSYININELVSRGLPSRMHILTAATTRRNGGRTETDDEGVTFSIEPFAIYDPKNNLAYCTDILHTDRGEPLLKYLLEQMVYLRNFPVPELTARMKKVVNVIVDIDAKLSNGDRPADIRKSLGLARKNLHKLAVPMRDLKAIASHWRINELKRTVRGAHSAADVREKELLTRIVEFEEQAIRYPSWADGLKLVSGYACLHRKVKVDKYIRFAKAGYGFREFVDKLPDELVKEYDLDIGFVMSVRGEIRDIRIYEYREDKTSGEMYFAPWSSFHVGSGGVCTGYLKYKNKIESRADFEKLCDDIAEGVTCVNLDSLLTRGFKSDSLNDKILKYCRANQKFIPIEEREAMEDDDDDDDYYEE
jgi:hypothetical protein|tara:strand:+ start:5188 stop:6621 length:1434 start_codon:yes stop_codon:yes gene_type:complete